MLSARLVPEHVGIPMHTLLMLQIQPAQNKLLVPKGSGTAGDFTIMPYDSNLMSSVTIGFKNTLMLGLVSPNHRPANMLFSFNVHSLYGNSLIK